MNFLVVKETNEFYLDKSSIKMGYYKFIGIESYETVTGALKEVMLFERVKKTLLKNDKN